MERKQRTTHGEEALRLQTLAGWKAMGIWTVVGIVTVGTLHRTWPLLRRQTLPFKVFIVSGFSMSGLVIGAENTLQAYENGQRQELNIARRWAKFELQKEGRIATEAEISRWISENKGLLQANFPEAFGHPNHLLAPTFIAGSVPAPASPAPPTTPSPPPKSSVLSALAESKAGVVSTPAAAAEQDVVEVLGHGSEQ